MPSHRPDASSAAAANDEVFPFFGIKTPRARLDLEQKSGSAATQDMGDAIGIISMGSDGATIPEGVW